MPAMRFNLIFSGKTSLFKKDIIIDIRGNPWGTAEYPNQFLGTIFFAGIFWDPANYSRFMQKLVSDGHWLLNSPAIAQYWGC